jgi:hypothetical protein
MDDIFLLFLISLNKTHDIFPFNDNNTVILQSTRSKKFIKEIQIKRCQRYYYLMKTFVSHVTSLIAVTTYMFHSDYNKVESFDI